MKKSLLLALAMLTPVAAFAAAGSPGAYVQGVVGGNAVFGDDNYSFNRANTLTGYSFGAAAGYLWGCSNLNYGVEVGALSYPDSTTSYNYGLGGIQSIDGKTDGYNIDLLGVLKYTFDSGFNVFAKAGVAYVNQKATADYKIAGVKVSSVSRTDDKYAPEVALGAGYQFNQNWEVNLTANTVFAGESSLNDAVSRTGNVLLGVTYHFA